MAPRSQHAYAAWSRVARHRHSAVTRWHERDDAARKLELDRSILTERAQFARRLDIELRVACRSEAASRHELGIAARELLRYRGYRRLGFVRLSDYTRERLGVSARTIQSASWVATRLDDLPLVATAFSRSDLSWSQVRAICAVAGRHDQELWLARARKSTVEELEHVARALQSSAATNRDPDHDDGTIDDEPAMHLRIACPARLRALWRRALDLASRVAGEPLARWQTTEFIAAEALSGRPPGVAVADRALLASMRVAKRARNVSGDRDTGSCAIAAAGDDASVDAIPDASAGAMPTTSGIDVSKESAASAALFKPIAADPFALDARLVEAMRAIRTCEPRIGRLLRIVVDQRVYCAHGFTSFAGYVRERLGISLRKAWALLKVERSTRRDDAFATAYDTGAISWVQALTLLPVVDRTNAAAWVARANDVTVRRLADEVNWVLTARDVHGSAVALDPPPADAELVSPVQISAHTATKRRAPSATRGDVQIGAHAAFDGGDASLDAALSRFDACRRSASEVRDAEIHVLAPVSVVALMRDALDAFVEPGAPRWAALEAVLRHVIIYWQSLPGHRDPVFARDGWRCTVPGCSSRRNLHDHHLRYRSRGGGDEPENRTAVCAAHHQHGIHDNTIRAWGSAPHDIHWQLGVRFGAAPLLAYVGDRICRDDAAAL